MKKNILFNIIVLLILFSSVNFGHSGKGKSQPSTISTTFGQMISKETSPVSTVSTKFGIVGKGFSFLGTISTFSENALLIYNPSLNQREDGTYLVDIKYDLADEGNYANEISLYASTDGGTTWGNYSCSNLTGDAGQNVYSGKKSIVWDFSAEHPDDYQNRLRIKIKAKNSSGVIREVVTNVIVAASIPLIAPVLISPGDTAAVNSTTVEFKWHSVPNARGYVIQISTVPNFQTCRVNKELNDTIYTAKGLHDGAVLYWRVRAKLNGLESITWSNGTTCVSILQFIDKRIVVKLLSSKDLSQYKMNYNVELSLKWSFAELKNPVKDSVSYIFNAGDAKNIFGVFRQIDKIIIKEGSNQIGHINFEYTFNDFVEKQNREVILILHDDDEMKSMGSIDYFPYGEGTKLEGVNYFTDWNYYQTGEYPVSMLVPPSNVFPSNTDNKPILFIHGLNGQYNHDPEREDKNDGVNGVSDVGYWGSTPRLVDEKDSSYASWQFYYPYNSDIYHNSLCLKKGIEWLKTKFNKKVRLVTHSMGGLVAHEYLTLNPELSEQNVEKVLFSQPPLRGSFAATTIWFGLNNLLGLSNGITAEGLDLGDKESPAYRDMAFGSEYLINSRDRILPDLNNQNGVRDDYFVLIGTTDKKAAGIVKLFIKENVLWANEGTFHNDAAVPISSASLLHKGIGFAAFYGNHADGICSNSYIENRVFLPNVIKTYFNSSVDNFIDSLNTKGEFSKIDVVVNPEKIIKKAPSQDLAVKDKPLYSLSENLWKKLSTQKEEVDFNKGLLTLAIKDLNSGSLKWGANDDEFDLCKLNNDLVLINSKFSPVINPDYLGTFIKNEDTGLFCFNNKRDGSAINLNGTHNIYFKGKVKVNSRVAGSTPMINSPSLSILPIKPVTRVFKPLEDNSWSIELNDRELNSLTKVQEIGNGSISLKSLESTNGEEVYQIDNSILSSTFYLGGYEDNPDFSNHQMRLTAPDGTIIDSVAASLDSVKYWFYSDIENGSAFIQVNDINPGLWKISWSPVLTEGYTSANVYSLIDIDLEKNGNSNLFIGDTLSISVPLPPDSLNATNPKLVSMLYYTPTGSDTLILQDSSECQIRDTVFIKNRIFTKQGNYMMNYTLSCDYNGSTINRTIQDNVSILGFQPPALYYPRKDSVSNSRNINLVWEKRNDAVSYDLRYYSDMDTTVKMFQSLTDTVYTINNLDFATNYFWSVKANSVDSGGVWSSLSNYRIDKSSEVPPGWEMQYADTLGTRMSILMSSDSKLTLNNQKIRDGNMVGVFFKNDSLICVGYSEYRTGGLSIIYAKGNDPMTPEKEGLNEGEQFYFKIWDSYNQAEYTVDNVYMKNNDTIFVSGASLVIDSLIIAGEPTGYKEMFLAGGWNMVSYPVKQNPTSMINLIPLINAGPYIFEMSSGYTLKDTLDEKRGCWIRISNGYTMNMSGKIIQDTLIAVKMGWNLIGGNSTITNAENIYSQPAGIITTAFWGFDSSGYYLSPEIKYGKGYWIRVSQDGNIVLSRVIGLNKSGERKSDLEEAFELTSNNKKRTLYLTGGKETDKYQSPPPSPSAYFDAKYEGDFYAESKEKASYQVVLNNAKFPIMIKSKSNDSKYDVVGLITNTNYGRLTGENVLRIDDEKDTRIVLNKVEIPTDYYLNQNYPNPFNPKTTIKFGLPEDQKVKLVVFDILGQEVERIVNDEFLKAGNHVVEWNAMRYASGVYLLNIQAGNFRSVKKMMLIK